MRWRNTKGITQKQKMDLTFVALTALLFLGTCLVVGCGLSLLELTMGYKDIFGQHRVLFWVLLIFGICVIGSMSSYMIGRPILRNLDSLSKAAREIRNGNFTARAVSGKILFFRGFTEDFNQMAKELGGIELLRSEFVNNFSHEFKTPIVSIKGFAEELKRDDLSVQEREEYLNIIIRESGRLSRLSTNILNLSKVEQQNILTDCESYNIGEQIRQAILLEMYPIEKKALELEINIEDCYIEGNPMLLEQVWINLLDNAIKFTKEGGTLWVDVHRQDEEVQIQIRDNGCGISQQDIPHIFDKFYHAETVHRKSSASGTGLGLTLVKKVVELHKGMITVESAEGKGTVAEVRLACNMPSQGNSF